jgi:hypothetical protein
MCLIYSADICVYKSHIVLWFNRIQLRSCLNREQCVTTNRPMESDSFCESDSEDVDCWDGNFSHPFANHVKPYSIQKQSFALSRSTCLSGNGRPAGSRECCALGNFVTLFKYSSHLLSLVIYSLCCLCNTCPLYNCFSAGVPPQCAARSFHLSLRTVNCRNCFLFSICVSRKCIVQCQPSEICRDTSNLSNKQRTVSTGHTQHYFKASSQNCEKKLLLRHVCQPVRTYVRIEQLGSRCTNFYKILYLKIFRRSVTKIEVPFKLDKFNEYFTWRPIYI